MAEREGEIFRTRSAAATIRLGRQLAERFAVGDCVWLSGGLGAGKTVLAKGIALGLGLDDPAVVTSPTFVLVHEYPTRIPLYHLDLYRITGGPAELAGLGIEEMLADGVVLVEWPERAGGALPTVGWQVDIDITGLRRRSFQVRRIG